MAADQHDVTRRETITAIGLTGAVGLSPAAAMANAQPDRSASNATYARSVEGMPSLSDYGTVEQGEDISSALTAAIADSVNNNTRSLRIPDGIFTVPSTVTIDAPDLTIHGHGSVIRSAMTSNVPLIKVEGDGVSIIGLRTELTDASTTTHMYRIDGDNCRLHLCDMDYTAGNVNTAAFYVWNADGFEMVGCRKWGSNAFIGNYRGSNGLIALNTVYGYAGGDDFLAIKATDSPSENIRVIGNHVHGSASIISIGTQIGMLGADDPDYTRAVRNVVVQGNVGHECARIAYIKPGQNAASDYRNGLVEDIVISDNTLTDPDGVKFDTGIDIRAGRGSIVRRVTGNNNRVYARAVTDASGGRKVGALNIMHQGGGSTPTVEDIDVETSYVDPYDGAAFGTTGTSGYPVENIVRIDPTDLNVGKVNLRIEGNGCSLSGVYVLSGCDGQVTVEKLKITNANATGNPTTQGGFKTASAVIVMTDNVEISTVGGAAKVTDTGGSFTAHTNPLLV